MQRTFAKKLQCTCCNNIFPIQRKMNKNRSAGHIKHLYCYKCKEQTAHVELNMYA